MKLHNSEMVDALVDGQLTGWRGWFARRHLSNCPICALEYRRQTHVRQMLAANPPARPVPASADEFWGRIRTEIEAQSAGAPATAPDPLHLSLRDWLWDQPALVPALALAVVVIACGVVWLRFGRPPAATPAPALVAQQQPAVVLPAPAAVAPEPAAVAPASEPEAHAALVVPEQPAAAPDNETTLAAVEQVETTVPHAVATTVHVEEGGVTVIWVSGLPWTDNMTDMQTLFAHPSDYFDI